MKMLDILQMMMNCILTLKICRYRRVHNAIPSYHCTQIILRLDHLRAASRWTFTKLPLSGAKTAEVSYARASSYLTLSSVTSGRYSMGVAAPSVGEGANAGYTRRNFRRVAVRARGPAVKKPGRIFTNPTLIELRQEISQYHWLRGTVTSFSALARSVRQS
ncbi:hypothetical protein AVEN_264318-1 [Araneus ventricosus]|uniref:Uncharacterized protein n=1 Tax=Araneus ventricosus TaxID=182803 RepID=A0A4Y2PB22_ARAVE|nr:hypothetical protein AVEN_264318-1 [Araneus ventricosus]